MAAKGTKKFVFLAVSFKVPRNGSKQNTKGKPKVTYLTWVMVFLAAENENLQMEGLPPADFGRVHENISFFGKEKVHKKVDSSFQ